MIIKYISSAVIVERIADEYNIKSEDYITKAPSWIYAALRKIAIKQQYLITNEICTITNGRYQIPFYIDKVYAVRIKGTPIDYYMGNASSNKYEQSLSLPIATFDGKVMSYNQQSLQEELNNSIVDNSVDINNVFGNRYNVSCHRENHIREFTNIRYSVYNGHIQFYGIDEGEFELVSGRIPYIVDESSELMWPVIPDNEALFESLIAYCLKNIVMRGYSHPVLNLRDNNPLTNPGLMFSNSLIAARNSCNSISPDARKTLSKILNITIL